MTTEKIANDHKLNSNSVHTKDDEACSQETSGQSEMGKGMMESEKTRTILPNQNAIEIVKSRLWRKSHSLNTVKAFDFAVKKFDKYLESKELTYEDVVKAPVQILDDFAAWMDKHYAPATTRNYVIFMAKLLKAMGAKIDDYEFRENVVLPKVEMFMDDKVNEEQIKRIIMGAKHEALKVLLMLMKDTPARPVEIIGLKFGDFNLAYEPPYFAISARLAKNDIPREVFFTMETKTALISYMQNREVRNKDDFVFLDDDVDELDEENFQKVLKRAVRRFDTAFRRIMRKRAFEDLNEEVKKRGKQKRYKIHIYSFKKFSFTRTADALGELAARAIKGDKEYVMTYYKKDREERAQDYSKVMPKLSIFTMDERSRVRKQVEEAMKEMKDKDLAVVLEFLNGKRLARE